MSDRNEERYREQLIELCKVYAAREGDGEPEHEATIHAIALSLASTIALRRFRRDPPQNSDQEDEILTAAFAAMVAAEKVLEQRLWGPIAVDVRECEISDVF